MDVKFPGIKRKWVRGIFFDLGILINVSPLNPFKSIKRGESKKRKNTFLIFMDQNFSIKTKQYLSMLNNLIINIYFYNCK